MGNELKNLCKIIKYDEVTSTNTLAKELAKSGEKSDTVIIANSQTAGKGRFSRRFYSPENSGIYMSILLHSEIDVSDITIITAAAAVAVCRAIKNICHVSPKIKWVNDLYLSNKKICGILTEGAINPATKKVDFAVVGMGVNLYENDFPPEIREIAGGIFENKVGDEIKEKLTNEIIFRFYEIFKALPDKKFMEEYRANSYLSGKTVCYTLNGAENCGEVIGIDDDAKLIVKNKDGKTEKLFSGEVSVKIK